MWTFLKRKRIQRRRSILINRKGTVYVNFLQSYAHIHPSEGWRSVGHSSLMIFVAPTSRRAVSLVRELNATRVKFSVINSLQDCEHEMVVQIQIRGRDAPVGIFTEVPSKIEIIPCLELPQEVKIVDHQTHPLPTQPTQLKTAGPCWVLP